MVERMAALVALGAVLIAGCDRLPHPFALTTNVYAPGKSPVCRPDVPATRSRCGRPGTATVSPFTSVAAAYYKTRQEAACRAACSVVRSQPLAFAVVGKEWDAL